MSEARLECHVITSSTHAFYGKNCGICRKRCVKGDVLLGWMTYNTSVAMHTRCLKEELEAAPLDKFEQIKEKILTTGVFGD